MAEKYKAHFKIGTQAASHDFAMKGQAFAFAKRKAPKEGQRIAVTRFVSVPKEEVDEQRDLREGHYWWRAVRRWNFNPDGRIEALEAK